MIKLSIFDKILNEINNYIKVSKNLQIATKISPSVEILDGYMSKSDKKHSAAMMRVNYTGEICAQALYRGQAIVTKSKDKKAHLYNAADEEYNHLLWCRNRLSELNARPSLLNIVWYWISFSIGVKVGLIGDQFSYGFIIETEKQVMKHLDSHIKSLPINDNCSRKILNQIYTDEFQHAINAKKAGGIELPFCLKVLMKLQSKVMTTIVYKC